MSRTKGIVYPPEDVLNPIVGKTDYDYVILWMLSNNDYCEWSDFIASISESTLSSHLRKLKNKNFVEKPERNKYQITQHGKEQFDELNYNRKVGKRRLKYPPKTILNRRNYDHWILWMLYNNYSCKWSDFKQNPLFINQSALSNNLNSLLEDGYITRENKEYIITPLGESQYFETLKHYDLDRQSILEQQSKRIEEITEKISDFFHKYKIKDQELKFRYINHLLTLNYSKVESTLRNEVDFYKILLFLAINHPDQYSNYISPEKFSIKYRIDITTLKYYIKEIVDNQFYQIKFFKIETEEGKVYYFQKNEPLEKILNAIVEKYTTKFTYLNKFQNNPTIDIELLLDNILNEVCNTIFNGKLKNTLKNFLPEYIKYLAYKIETEKTLINSEAKLEGLVWQNIFEEFQTFIPSTTQTTTGELEENYYLIDKQIFDILEFFYVSKLNFLKTDDVQDIFNFRNVNVFDEISKLLYKDNTSKARALYEKAKGDLTYIHQLILQDAIVTSEHNYIESIKITSEIIKKYPKEFIGYLLQSISYFLMDNYEYSLEIIERGFKEAPNILLLCQKFQIFIKNHRGEEIINDIDEALSKYPHHNTLLRIKIILYLADWDNFVKSRDYSINLINSAIKVSPKDSELLLLKSIFYLLTNKYSDAKKFLINEINLNLFNKNPKIDIAAFFILICSYTACGKYHKALRIADQLNEIYPNHPISYLTKALVHGYNLIYKFNLEEPNLNTFFELINKTCSLEHHKYNKVKYLLLQAIVLYGIKQFDQVIETINNAIELLPNYYYLRHMKIYYLMIANRESEALELIEELVDKHPNLKNALFYQKVCVLFKIKRYDEALKINEELLKLYPERIEFINNKTMILGYLGKREEAIETAEKLIQLNPNISNSYDTYGDIYMKFQDYENAIKKFEEALKIESTSNITFYTWLRLGYCYKKIKNYEKAHKYFEIGKKLAERMIPSIREFYLPEAQKQLSELRSMMKNEN
ncbi:MAG: hypothetical protein HWN81_13620 [Candidatus Lokiarchaeota archaeon]|nr:hypothetical protein [Candidatus Lokiarchaeota archaeon]